MAFHPRQNSMFHFTFYFSHFILHLLFDIRVYTFVIQLSSCNIQVFALYIHLFVRNIQVHVQVQRVALPSFRIQCWAFANQVFAFNIWHCDRKTSYRSGVGRPSPLRTAFVALLVNNIRKRKEWQATLIPFVCENMKRTVYSFALTSRPLKDFPFLYEMIRGYLKIWRSRGCFWIKCHFVSKAWVWTRMAGIVSQKVKYLFVFCSFL